MVGDDQFPKMSAAIPAFEPADVPPDARVAVVAARFNGHIVDQLLAGCLRRLAELGVAERRVEVHRVPGAFELPVAARALARTGRFAAVICLGCVVRGDTPHFDYVAGEAARGIQQVAIDQCLPVIFGVLTTNTEQQALDRTGGPHGHAGERAAEAAAEMIAVLARVSRGGIAAE
jgi:6,7-dimethyl-8-ribityllumazine synthase